MLLLLVRVPTPPTIAMSNDVSPEAMQTRIQQARREAENLKDRIKRKKDDLADGTREFSSSFGRQLDREMVSC